jgi:hypothetical protein
MSIVFQIEPTISELSDERHGRLPFEIRERGHQWRHDGVLHGGCGRSLAPQPLHGTGLSAREQLDTAAVSESALGGHLNHESTEGDP